MLQLPWDSLQLEMHMHIFFNRGKPMSEWLVHNTAARYLFSESAYTQL